MVLTPQLKPTKNTLEVEYKNHVYTYKFVDSKGKMIYKRAIGEVYHRPFVAAILIKLARSEVRYTMVLVSRFDRLAKQYIKGKVVGYKIAVKDEHKEAYLEYVKNTPLI